MEVFKNASSEKNSWETWETSFKVCREGFDEGRIGFFSQNNIGAISAVGIRDYSNKISKDQTKWCIERVLELANTSIVNQKSASYLNMESNPFDEEPSLSILPNLLNLEISEEQESLCRLLIFSSFLELRTDNGIHSKIIKHISTKLWETSPAFANSCIRGIIYFGSFSRPRGHGYIEPNDESLKYEESVKSIYEEVVKLSITEPNWNALNYTKYGSWFYDKAFDLLPESHKFTEEHIKFCYKYLNLLFEETKSNERRDFGEHDEKNPMASHDFEWKIGKLLIQQNDEFTQPLFDFLLSLGFKNHENLTTKSYDFLADCLKYTLCEEIDILTGEKFWYMWERLFEKMKEKSSDMFFSQLLLKVKWIGNPRDWKPLSDKISFYKEIIYTFGDTNLDDVITFLGGIGCKSMLPQGISWITDISKKGNNWSWTSELNAEKLIQRCYYLFEDEIKHDKGLLVDFILLLDHMVDSGSSLAFFIRENMI